VVPQEPAVTAVAEENLALVHAEEAGPEPEPSAPKAADALPLSEIELEQDADKSRPPATDNAMPVSVTAPLNGADGLPNESPDDEATRRNHQSESKPEVTT
jgi:hypothetical protein